MLEVAVLSGKDFARRKEVFEARRSLALLLEGCLQLASEGEYLVFVSLEDISNRLRRIRH